jgi:hypothetical protein
MRSQDACGLDLGEKERPVCILPGTVGGESSAVAQRGSRSRKTWHIDVEQAGLSIISIFGGVLTILLTKEAF